MPVQRSPALSRKKPSTLPDSADRSETPERRAAVSSQQLREKNKSDGDGKAGKTASETTEELPRDQGGSTDKGMDQIVDKPVGKLDESMYKIFGPGAGSVSSLSRSSSDTSQGSENAYCKGGPAKKACGNLVKDGEAGVQCDGCHDWFHVTCQGIPKPAIKALEKYDSLAWLCPDCKIDLKKGKRQQDLVSSLELKFTRLAESVREELDQAAKSAQEQAERNQALWMKSMETYTKCVKEQTQDLELSIQQHKLSYAEAVKGTCSEVEKTVKCQLASIPKPNSTNSTKDTRDLSQILDDHLDKEKRKGNIVVHNLPEHEGDTLADRSSKDITEFTIMVKEVMRLNVSTSRSFRVGKKNQAKPRLLIVTLDNPSMKHDILRGAPQLRHTERYSNIYLTPDLTQKEREEGRKLREELSRRRKAGETNLIIRGGKIVSQPYDHAANQMGNEAAPAHDSRRKADQPTGTVQTGASVATEPPVPSCRSGEHMERQSSDDGAPALPSSGGGRQLEQKSSSDVGTPSNMSGVPAASDHGSRRQNNDRNSAEASSATAVPCCGSRRQDDERNSAEMSRAPAVPCCGSRRQDDDRNLAEISGSPAVPNCGSRRHDVDDEDEYPAEAGAPLPPKQLCLLLPVLTKTTLPPRSNDNQTQLVLLAGGA